MWYKNEYWMTYCGLHVSPKSSDCFGDGTYFMGLSYDVEHNQVLISCPYDRCSPCVFRERIFDNTALGKPFSRYCVSEPADCNYDYEQSAEKIYKEEADIYYRKKEAFLERYPLFRGCLCLKRSKDGRIVFDRFYYKYSHCVECRNEICGLTGKKRDLTMVNIVGDYEYIQMPGSFFEKIIREVGRKVSKFPTTADSAARMMRSLEGYSPSSFYDHFSMGKPKRMYLKKVGSRRNLLDDLIATAEGIEVQHSKDIVREKAQEKRNSREKRRKQTKAYPVRKIKRWAEEYLERDTLPETRMEAERKLIEYGIDVKAIQDNYLTETIRLL